MTFVISSATGAEISGWDTASFERKYDAIGAGFAAHFMAPPALNIGDIITVAADSVQVLRGRVWTKSEEVGGATTICAYDLTAPLAWCSLPLESPAPQGQTLASLARTILGNLGLDSVQTEGGEQPLDFATNLSTPRAKMSASDWLGCIAAQSGLVMRSDGRSTLIFEARKATPATDLLAPYTYTTETDARKIFANVQCAATDSFATDGFAASLGVAQDSKAISGTLLTLSPILAADAKSATATAAFAASVHVADWMQIQGDVAGWDSVSGALIQAGQVVDIQGAPMLLRNVRLTATADAKIAFFTAVSNEAFDVSLF